MVHEAESGDVRSRAQSRRDGGPGRLLVGTHHLGGGRLEPRAPSLAEHDAPQHDPAAEPLGQVEPVPGLEAVERQQAIPDRMPFHREADRQLGTDRGVAAQQGDPGFVEERAGAREELVERLRAGFGGFVLGEVDERHRVPRGGAGGEQIGQRVGRRDLAVQPVVAAERLEPVHARHHHVAARGGEGGGVVGLVEPEADAPIAAAGAGAEFVAQAAERPVEGGLAGLRRAAAATRPGRSSRSGFRRRSARGMPPPPAG